MIFHENKCIFMHINKTGGTSIETTLQGFKPHPFHPEKHMDSKSMIELYGKEKWQKYFTFTFVRNPWDRMLSLFLWRKKVKFISKDLKFKNFIMDWDYWRVYKRIRYENSKRILTSAPQSDWFNGELEFDFVGKFENIQNDFDKICEYINFKKVKLPHRYKTEHDHYSLYYDKDMKNEVERFWGKDIELFKYKFEAS